MDLNREEYDRFVAESPQGTVYCYSWWLDAVCPGSWNVAIVRSNGRIVAALPYRIRTKLGVIRVDQPDLCPILGVLFQPLEGRYSTQLGKQKELMTELIKRIPQADLVSITCHYSLQNWLPFCWAGYQQTTSYTYVLENLTEMDLVWNDFRKTMRNDIRRAEKSLRVEVNGCLEEFLNLYDASFRRQGMSRPVPEDVIRRVDSACAQRSSRVILLVRDQENRPHAGVYLVWDEKSAYYLMGGADPARRKSGAQTLALWHAIQHASRVSKAFDFEGSMNENIESFFRGFGARQKPMMTVFRQSPKYRVFKALANLNLSFRGRLNAFEVEPMEEGESQ